MEAIATQTIPHTKSRNLAQLRDWVTPLATGSFVGRGAGR